MLTICLHNNGGEVGILHAIDDYGSARSSKWACQARRSIICHGPPTGWQTTRSCMWAAVSMILPSQPSHLLFCW